MKYDDIIDVLRTIRGCTFASIDTKTEPTPGISVVTIGQSIILYNGEHSLYESMVKRRMLQAGLSGEFIVDDLSWGHRESDQPSCLIFNCHVYLQTILIGDPAERYGDMFGTKLPYLDIEKLLPRQYRTSLEEILGDNQVKVRTYRLSSITAIRLMGETLPK